VESAVKVFGQVVKVHRERAGLTQKQLAGLVFCSDSLISAIEKGTKPANQELLERIDAELKAEGVILAVWPITELGGYPSEFIASQESEASKIHDWEPRMIPGLAQTADYTRAVMRAARPRDKDDSIEKEVQIRVGRQGIFDRDNPPMVWLVIDESALYRPFGGRDVMHDQLSRLETIAATPNTVIQVMRFSATSHPGAEGPMRVIEFNDSSPIWYTEGWFSGRLSESRVEVSDAMTWFDLIRASALSPDQTMRLITKVRETRYE
jgi:transcriptional regulator with XRE-family HTH domain